MISNLLIFIVISLVLSIILIPIIIKFCQQYSLYDTVNARKIHSGNIPRLGGIAIALSFLISIIVFLIVEKNTSFKQSLPLIISGSLIFLFGIIDDLKELKAFYKLCVQIVASLIVVLNGFEFRQFFGWQLPTYISLPFTFFWILGIINAYNLIDGMDGLCGTLCFTALITLGIALFDIFPEGAAICFVLSASIFGFLIFNYPFPDAKIFMGDAGSQFLGFMIATIPLYNFTKINARLEYYKLLVMLVLVAFPMMDTIAAIWRRLRDHRSILSPDKFHLHHKLLNIGFTKFQTLVIVTFIQTMLCIVVLYSINHREKVALFFLFASYAFMLCFFGAIHFVNKAVTRKIIDRDKIYRKTHPFSSKKAENQLEE